MLLIGGLTYFTTEELTAIFISLKVALLCTLIALPISLGLGWLLARKEFPGKILVDSLINLPMVMPPVTTGYLLLLILGSQGIIGQYLYAWFGIRLPFSFAAVVLAAVIVSMPLMVRSIRTAIEMVDPALENSARTMGYSTWGTFLKVTLPLARPGVLGGAVLCFARSLGEFGATVTFAGNIPGKTQTIALAVYSHMQIPNHENLTLRLVVVSIVLSLLAMFFAEYFNRKRKRRTV